MRYLPVVILALAGWLTLSAALARLLSPVMRGLKQSRSEERKVSLSVEDRTPDDLMDVADVVQAPAAPFCYRDGLFPDGRTYHDIWPAPAETYGYERLYNASDLVQVGLAMVHRRCADARRDAATDHICNPCGRIFGKAMTS